jgi:asparagine synthase (glutamine-hydrolysing)
MLAAFLAGDRAQNCHGMTFFDGVSSLIPGHLAIVNRKGITTRRYWDFDPKRQTRFGSFKEYAEVFGNLFEQAVSRRLRSARPVAVSVSGGLDSSSIYCMSERIRRREPDRFPSVVGVSYTSADGTPSDEKSYLAEIERQYGTTIERFPMSGPGFLDGCLEEVWHVESPFLDLQWNSTVGLMRFLQQKGTRVLLTGSLG